MAFLDTLSSKAGAFTGRGLIAAFKLIARNFALIEPSARDSGAADYSPVAGDINRTVLRSRGTAQTVTLPAEATTSLPIGSRVEFIQTGAGALTFQAGAGATMQRDAFYTAVARGQHARVTAIKIGTNTWNISGGLGLT